KVSPRLTHIVSEARSINATSVPLLPLHNRNRPPNPHPISHFVRSSSRHLIYCGRKGLIYLEDTNTKFTAEKKLGHSATLYFVEPRQKRTPNHTPGLSRICNRGGYFI